MRAYAGNDLDGNLLRAVSYSLQKAFVKFDTLEAAITWKEAENVSDPALNYFWKIPFRFLTTGRFFSTLFDVSSRARRQNYVPDVDVVIRFVRLFLYALYQ